MNDRVFFSSALLLAMLLVLLALQPAAGALPSGSVSGGDTDYTEVTVDGRDLNRIVAGGESRITLIGDGNDRVLRIETEAGVLSEDPIKGPHFRLAADLEAVFERQTLEITVRAKPSARYGAQEFIANYTTGKDGESGWTRFDMVPRFADYAFTYRVPRRGSDHGVDYLAIRPVTPEKRRAIEIESITLRPLGYWTD